MIVPYIPGQYNIKSTYEFLRLLRNCHNNSGNMVFLDVESLFSNVPVHQTIDIIINNVYNHENLPAPKIDRDTLRKHLLLCTTRTPFKHINGDIYLQRDGVSMGSCLGPTFADFYMCNLENTLFSERPDLKLTLYTRYVDDIFIVMNDLEKLNQIKTYSLNDPTLNLNLLVYKVFR